MELDVLFENIFQKLVKPDFGKNLGGEMPLFIQPLPVNLQQESEDEIERLVKRLRKQNINVEKVNLYDLMIEILSREGLLETLLTDEANIECDYIISTLDSVLDVQSVILPYLQQVVSEKNPHYLFISGVGTAYPFIRSHNILNNIDGLSKDTNLILFFPGEYDNLQLKLFDKISDENYYRGHNINDIQ